MKKFFYGVFDRKARQVLSEFTDFNDESASRSFLFSLARNPFYRDNASDFQLLLLGAFETDTGSLINSGSGPLPVCDGSSELVSKFINDLEVKKDERVG